MKLTSMMTMMLFGATMAFATTAYPETNMGEGFQPSDYSKHSTELYSEESNPQLYCLALNIYHESRSDNLAGQFAVADVVLNRVNDSRYPNTICEVIKQGPISKWWKEEKGKEVPVRHKCQFSWWCDGKSDEPTQLLSWLKAQEVAYHIVMNNQFRGVTEGATHYHATYVNPSWNRSMVLIGRIGEHIFYKSLPK